LVRVNFSGSFSIQLATCSRHVSLSKYSNLRANKLLSHIINFLSIISSHTITLILKKFSCKLHTICVSYRTRDLCEVHKGFRALTNILHLTKCLCIMKNTNKFPMITWTDSVWKRITQYLCEVHTSFVFSVKFFYDSHTNPVWISHILPLSYCIRNLCEFHTDISWVYIIIIPFSF
jgi:hypothetical protein